MTNAFRSILVPLDGAEVAEQALAVGASLAARAGATLHLVSALEPVPIAVAAEFGYYGVEPDSETRMRVTGYLAELADATRRAMGLAVEVAIVEGDAVDTLAEYVEGRGIDLVVMTTHARRRLDRFWLGSVADRLLRRVSVPVLLLHPSDRPQPTRFRRILIALDGQIEAPVLDAATTLCSLEPEAEYTLFRVADQVVSRTDLPVLVSPLGHH
jgi:nucleotide-binding universal stress UspA family protein